MAVPSCVQGGPRPSSDPVNASSRNGEGTAGRRGGSASGARGPGDVRQAPLLLVGPNGVVRLRHGPPTGKPPDLHADDDRRGRTRALCVAWAVASVSGASSRRSSASRARVRGPRWRRPTGRQTQRPSRGAPRRRLSPGSSCRLCQQLAAERDETRGSPVPCRSRPPPGAGRRRPGESSSSSIRGARNGSPRRRATDDRRQQLAVRAGQDGPRRAVVRPGPDRRARAGRSRRTGPGARTSRPVAAGPAPDRLGEPLAVVLDEPNGPLDDLTRAAVVHLEIDPAQAGQEGLEPRGSAGRRRAASHRSTGRRRRPGRSGWPGRPAAARAGAGRDRRPGPRRRAVRGNGRASGRARVVLFESFGSSAG